MNCRRAEEMFVEYLYGELEPDLAEQLRTHLDGCPSCKTRMAELARVRQLVAQVPDVEPSPLAINRVIARAREEERSRSIWGFRWVKVLAPLCLAVVVGGLVAYQFRTGLAPKPMVYTPAKEEQRSAVPEPLPAAAAKGKPSPVPARDKGKLPAPVAPQAASPKPAPAAEHPGVSPDRESLKKAAATEGERGNLAALPPPPATEHGARETTAPQPSADSASSRAANPGASQPSLGQAPPAALLSAQQRRVERPAVGSARAPMPAGAPPQAKAAAREEAMTSAAGKKPEASAPGLLDAGDKALEARRYGEAEMAFSQALRLLPPGHPDRPRALLGRARAQEGKKDLTGALQTYGELAKESPTYRDLAERKIQELSGPDVK